MCFRGMVFLECRPWQARNLIIHFKKLIKRNTSTWSERIALRSSMQKQRESDNVTNASRLIEAEAKKIDATMHWNANMTNWPFSVQYRQQQNSSEKKQKESYRIICEKVVDTFLDVHSTGRGNAQNTVKIVERGWTLTCPLRQDEAFVGLTSRMMMAQWERCGR